jgi:hypothetical protein
MTDDTTTEQGVRYIDCTPDFAALDALFMNEWRNGERALRTARHRMADIWSLDLTPREEAEERRWLGEQEAAAAVQCADAARMLLAIRGITLDD